MAAIAGYLLDGASRLDALLRSLLARRYRVVCFVGLPATGKSLLVQQLALLAASRGRDVSTLQWDVARPALQRCEAAAPYPDVRGITPPLIIRAAGLWARDAVAAWDARSGDDGLLIIEAPLIGGRFVELASQIDDAAEPLLADQRRSRFQLLVPSEAVRARMEAERAAHHATPRHALEREDAAPDVLRRMWQELLDEWTALGETVPDAATNPLTYGSRLYTHHYLRLFRGRVLTPVPLEELVAAGATSVYETNAVSLTPTLAEADVAVRRAESEGAPSAPAPEFGVT